MGEKGKTEGAKLPPAGGVSGALTSAVVAGIGQGMHEREAGGLEEGRSQGISLTFHLKGPESNRARINMRGMRPSCAKTRSDPDFIENFDTLFLKNCWH